MGLDLVGLGEFGSDLLVFVDSWLVGFVRIVGSVVMAIPQGISRPADPPCIHPCSAISRLGGTPQVDPHPKLW